MITITPGAVVEACDQSQRQWNYHLRRHGLRSSAQSPLPLSPLSLLVASTGLDQQACLGALLEADAFGFVVYLGEGTAHITPKGKRLLIGPFHRWAADCSRRCRLA